MGVELPLCVGVALSYHLFSGVELSIGSFCFICVTGMGFFTKSIICIASINSMKGESQ